MSVRTARRARFFPFSRAPQPTPKGLRIPLRNARKLLDQGALEAAQLVIDPLIAQAPYDVRVLVLSAQFHASKGDHKAAVQVCDKLLNQQESDAIWVTKARSLKALNRYHRAAAAFARASALADTTQFVAEHAECLLAAGSLNDALVLLEGTPASIAPDLRRQMVHAKVLAEKGQSRAAFDLISPLVLTDQTGHAVTLAQTTHPNPAQFFKMLDPAVLRLSSPNLLAALACNQLDIIPKDTIERLVLTVGDVTCDERVKAQAHLVLFRHYDRQEDGFEALAHLRKYHALSLKHTNYKPTHESALFTVLARMRLEPRPPSKNTLLPIFVTGLPGSGCKRAATLLGQAARCGPPRTLSVVPAIMSRFMRQFRAGVGNDVSCEAIQSLQSELREGLAQAANGSDVIIDQTPTNFIWSGLIAAALPEARIVHMKRNQMTTGWAIHTGGWTTSEYGCQHDLDHIQAFQQHSSVLMSHWEEVCWPNVMSTSGDALARASGATAKAMVEACQLKWSSQCNPIPVSADQSWRRYAAYLNPLRTPTGTPQTIACDQSTK